MTFNCGLCVNFLKGVGVFLQMLPISCCKVRCTSAKMWMIIRFFGKCKGFS
jgi:hypothetical protein